MEFCLVGITILLKLNDMGFLYPLDISILHKTLFSKKWEKYIQKINKYIMHDLYCFTFVRDGVNDKSIDMTYMSKIQNMTIVLTLSFNSEKKICNGKCTLNGILMWNKTYISPRKLYHNLTYFIDDVEIDYNMDLYRANHIND